MLSLKKIAQEYDFYAMILVGKHIDVLFKNPY